MPITKSRFNPGRRLQRARQAAGLSRQAVASRLNVKPEVIKHLDRWDLSNITDAQSRRLVRKYAIVVDQNPADFEGYVPDEERTTVNKSRLFVLSRTSLNLLIASLLIVLFGFIGWRTFEATARPGLMIDQPVNEQVLSSPLAAVSGRTSERAQVYINGLNVPVSPDGSFHTEVILSRGTNNIQIIAINGFGRQVEVSRLVVYQP
ncbi:MAG TPA: helix-turn-helix domain-containing protein [Candidatus Saccharimonadales bacterium]